MLDNFPKQKLFVLLTEINHNLIIGNKYKLLLLRHIMNKKLVTLIIVVLISFCFLSIVVADNISQTHNDSIVPDKSDDIQPSDKNVTPEKNQSDNKTKGNYILAKGSGDDIKFSDGFRGFRLDYSKPAATSGDEFKRASASVASNANTLEEIIVGCYELGLSGHVGEMVAEYIQTGGYDDDIDEILEASHQKVSNHVSVKINDKTRASFNFEVLQSVSGNESDYFAYTVSYSKINNNTTNETNNLTNITNITGNFTNMTDLFDNETFLDDLFEFLLYLADLLYDAWEHIIDTIVMDMLMIINAIEELVKFYEQVMAEIQALMDAIDQLVKMLEDLWKEIDGFLKLVAILLNALQQLFDLIQYVLNLIMQLISAIIALIQQLLALLYSLINFIIDLINQLISLIQAILDFLKAVGNALVKVIENAVIIIVAFLAIAIGTFVYNRRK